MSDKKVATSPRTDAAPFGRTEGSGPEVSTFTLHNGLDVVVIPTQESCRHRGKFEWRASLDPHLPDPRRPAGATPRGRARG